MLQPEPEGVVDVRFVGQCSGDKRKHEDLVAVEQCIATPVPAERGDDDLVAEDNRGIDQDAHEESPFREELAERRLTSRSQSVAT